MARFNLEEELAALKLLVEEAMAMAYERQPEDFERFGCPSYITEAEAVIKRLTGSVQ